MYKQYAQALICVLFVVNSGLNAGNATPNSSAGLGGFLVSTALSYGAGYGVQLFSKQIAVGKLNCDVASDVLAGVSLLLLSEIMPKYTKSSFAPLLVMACAQQWGRAHAGLKSFWEPKDASISLLSYYAAASAARTWQTGNW